MALCISEPKRNGNKKITSQGVSLCPVSVREQSRASAKPANREQTAGRSASFRRSQTRGSFQRPRRYPEQVSAAPARVSTDLPTWRELASLGSEATAGAPRTSATEPGAAPLRRRQVDAKASSRPACTMPPLNTSQSESSLQNGKAFAAVHRPVSPSLSEHPSAASPPHSSCVSPAGLGPINFKTSQMSNPFKWDKGTLVQAQGGQEGPHAEHRGRRITGDRGLRDIGV